MDGEYTSICFVFAFSQRSKFFFLMLFSPLSIIFYFSISWNNVCLRCRCRRLNRSIDKNYAFRYEIHYRWKAVNSFGATFSVSLRFCYSFIIRFGHVILHRIESMHVYLSKKLSTILVTRSTVLNGMVLIRTFAVCRQFFLLFLMFCINVFVSSNSTNKSDEHEWKRCDEK